LKRQEPDAPNVFSPLLPLARELYARPGDRIIQLDDANETQMPTVIVQREGK
jgi:hypothetical protein